jgi:hypothetical protein
MMRTVLIWLCFTVPALSQSLSVPSGKFVYIEQIGNNNSAYVEQVDDGEQRALIVTHGDGNDITILQHGSGSHMASIGPDGATAANSINNSNEITILQTGDGNHSASVVMSDTAANSNNTASITQSGGAGADKQFTLQLSGSNIGATVVQDNPTVPDSSSMSIQCYTGSCTGYSYVKH